MKAQITLESLQAAGMSPAEAGSWLPIINDFAKKYVSQAETWLNLSKLLVANNASYDIHHAIFANLFPSWKVNPETAPAWISTDADKSSSNLQKLIDEQQLSTVKDIHLWSRDHSNAFWAEMLAKLGINFKTPPNAICDLSDGNSQPSWLPGASLNIVDSCLKAQPNATAIVHHENNSLVRITYAELATIVNRIANSLLNAGFKEQDAIAIAMPMNPIAVAAYLAIIKIGGIVVSIADSFSSHEMHVRLEIANTKAVFTQDYSAWGQKKIPIYEKVCAANAPLAIVVTSDDANLKLRDGDITYNDFLVSNDKLESASCRPMQTTNILFSSGTTGTPKAISWNHTTPLKAASDAYLHQNIQPGDVLAWPTNLGWMMGPWLIYAALINNATIALYSGAPHERGFGKFVQNAKVTMLGVVPTLVAHWHRTKVMEEFDWSYIKVFSSTGECSNPEDMFYLMWLANYKPVIEYCGGTEIGGAYVSSTTIQNNYPSLFTTPTMGSDFIILNQKGKPADTGETALIPPAMGLSVELLNAEHESVYFKDMPLLNGVQLRRHGDQISRLHNDLFTILGRVDDTMNLGGIKISSAEIERVLSDMAHIQETAAIAVKSSRGPSQLIIYAVTDNTSLDKKTLLSEMQLRINQYLNPLFKISDLVFIKDLPKTASNKIMRRVLRKEYMEEHCS